MTRPIRFERAMLNLLRMPSRMAFGARALRFASSAPRAVRLLAGIGLWLAVASCGPAVAFEPLEGCFVADRVCPALSSIRRGSNPGDLATEAGRAYPLLGANRAQRPSHLHIRMPDARPPERWVAVGCGHRVATCAPGGGEPEPGGAAGDYVLAASWQPAFCEGHQEKLECQTQTPARFDATNFALHGLWPQPRDKEYCGVGRREREIDRAGRWVDLPAPEVAPETRAQLETVMPGTRSHLERHEWIKHGTCYGGPAEEYFAESLQLMGELNRSAVRELFAGRIGDRVSAAEVRAAFDQAFGPGAGARVEIDCDDGMFVELRLHLSGEITGTTALADLLAAADPASVGCAAGRIDPAGFER